MLVEPRGLSFDFAQDGSKDGESPSPNYFILSGSGDESLKRQVERSVMLGNVEPKAEAPSYFGISPCLTEFPAPLRVREENGRPTIGAGPNRTPIHSQIEAEGVLVRGKFAASARSMIRRKAACLFI